MLAAIITCAIMGHGAFTHPDNAWGCTPGHFDRITRAQACTHRDRPTLHAADRRAILAAYGVPNWSGADGELDHREPFWLGGTTDPMNIWPEPGSIPNPKDKLEDLLYRRVCTGLPHPMRLRTARRIFAADWRAAYLQYIGPLD